MANNSIFQTIEKPKPPRSRFDLSHSVRGTYDMGLLYPVQCDIGIPGDVWDMGIDCVARLMPAVCPVMDSIRVYFHTWKAPIRLLDENFEDFITGGEDGSDSYTVPTWDPSDNAIGSLWDYMGFPTGVDPTGKRPMIYPLYAYNMIYNEHYRDQNLITEYALTDEDIKRRAWERDYFNASSPVQQKGTAPSFPISGTTSAVYTAAPAGFTTGDMYGSSSIGSSNGIGVYTSTNKIWHDTDAVSATQAVNALNLGKPTLAEMNANTVDLSTATTFSLNDFRLVAVIQQYMELMQRSGARYPEYLEALFDQKNLDKRLDRPEYIGGAFFDVNVTEVLQTSESGTTPQGNLAGHGIARGANVIGKCRIEEWSIIMTLMSIMPESVYNTQGVNRQWTPTTKEEWYNPLFAHLAEQPIYRAELYATATESENNTVFGYQGRWDEHRQKANKTAGLMRTDFDQWTVARQFSSAPLLNQSFIECTPREDFLAVPSEPAFIMNIGNRIMATRPLPALASPGLRRI